MVLCLRLSKLAILGLGLTSATFCQDIPTETRRNAEVWLRAALDPLDQIPDAEQSLQFRQVYRGWKSVSLLFRQGTVLLSNDLRKVLGVGLLGITRGSGEIGHRELVMTCKAFTLKVLGEVEMNWATAQPLDRTGSWQIGPAFTHNGIPLSDCGLSFTVDASSHVITSASIVGKYPLPSFEDNPSPIVSPADAKRSAVNALLSSDPFNFNVVQEPVLTYRVPYFGPMPIEFSERLDRLREAKIEVKLYMVRFFDGESWDPETGQYRDQKTVFVDAVTGQAICVTIRASQFQMGSMFKSATKSNPIHAIPKNHLECIKGKRTFR